MNWRAAGEYLVSMALIVVIIAAFFGLFLLIAPALGVGWALTVVVGAMVFAGALATGYTA